MNLKSIGIMIVIGVISGIIKDMITEWLWPEAPLVMFIIYSILMTLVGIAFAIAIVYALCRVLWEVWKLLTDRGQRRDVWDKMCEKVRQWPTGKRDAFTAMTMTWITALLVPLFVLIFTVSEGQLAGRVPIETFLIILILAIVPMYVLLGWYGFEFLRQLKRDWSVKTRNEKIRIFAIAGASVVIFALLMWGDVSGWDDRLAGR